MKRVLMLLGGLALTFGSVAKAVTIADINSQDLFGCGVGCAKVDDKLFRGLSVSGEMTASNVTVTVGTATQDGISYDFISFSGPFTTTNSTIGRDFQIFYDVTAINGLIASIDQNFNLSGSAGGTVAIGESVKSGSQLGPEVAHSNVGFGIGGADISDPPGEEASGDRLNLTAPLTHVYVSKDVFLLAAPDGIVGATIITQSFHQVPEPAQSAIVLGACLLIGLYYKSRKRAQANA